MTNPALGRLKIDRLTGSEVFHENGRPAGFDVLDFWRWSASDLVMNTTRGILAEYVVARALGVPTDRAREGWSAFDLLTTDGLRIEVKSAAYVQSWAQDRFSTIQFLVPKRLGWDPDTNVMETEARRHADVYVLALLAHKDLDARASALHYTELAQGTGRRSSRFRESARCRRPGGEQRKGTRRLTGEMSEGPNRQGETPEHAEYDRCFEVQRRSRTSLRAAPHGFPAGDAGRLRLLFRCELPLNGEKPSEAR